MGSVTRPRGRLPRRVYWLRRAVVLFVGLLLVLGVGRLVGGLGSDPTDTATPASGTTSAPAGATPTAAASSTSAAPVGPVAPPVKALRHRAGRATQTGAPLATPSGPCRVEDVSVLPQVPQAPGGGDIPIMLQLVGTQPACTFTVSAKTLAVKITHGDSTFWTSQQCPAAIPRTQVVVRSGVPAVVPVTWNGRASDDQCSNRTAWADFGSYRVYAAAIGSRPSDVDFEVTKPERVVTTKTMKPKPATASSSASTGTASSPSPTR